MSLPETIEDAITPRMRYYLNAVARAGNELIVDVVPCWCGAKEGEYCRGRYGHVGSSLHADRRCAANRWKKAHPKEWKRLKDETFRRIIKQATP